MHALTKMINFILINRNEATRFSDCEFVLGMPVLLESRIKVTNLNFCLEEIPACESLGRPHA